MWWVDLFACDLLDGYFNDVCRSIGADTACAVVSDDVPCYPGGTEAGRWVAGLAEGRRGRNAGQVDCESFGPRGCVLSPWTAWVLAGQMGWMLKGGAVWMMKGMCLAALVEATADTVSSEVGQAFGGSPVMITTLRRVEAGTDGAVTVLGSCAGVLGGAVVALAGEWAIEIGLAGAMIALVAGVCGLFFDSIVGATVERVDG